MYVFHWKTFHPSQMGHTFILYLFILWDILQFYCFHSLIFAKQTICFSFPFAKCSFITKYCMLSRFGYAT